MELEFNLENFERLQAKLKKVTESKNAYKAVVNDITVICHLPMDTTLEQVAPAVKAITDRTPALEPPEAANSPPAPVAENPEAAPPLDADSAAELINWAPKRFAAASLDQENGTRALVKKGQSLRRNFPEHLSLKGGEKFVDGRKIPMRIVGYLAHRPAFGIVAVPARLLDDSEYVFKPSDFSGYRTSMVVELVGGEHAVNRKRSEELSRYASEYGVWPEAITKGVRLLLRGYLRHVKVFEIARSTKKPILVKCIANPRKVWCITTSKLQEASPLGKRSIDSFEDEHKEPIEDDDDSVEEAEEGGWTGHEGCMFE